MHPKEPANFHLNLPRKNQTAAAIIINPNPVDPAQIRKINIRMKKLNPGMNLIWIANFLLLPPPLPPNPTIKDQANQAREVLRKVKNHPLPLSQAIATQVAATEPIIKR